jgi:hypothetical protein
MKMSKALRGNRDVPQVESVSTLAVTAGTGTDYEHIIAALPKLYTGAPTGNADFVADNTMTVRWLNITYEAAVTGQATNYYALQLNQRRAGALLVNTTSSTAVSVAGTSVQITVGANAANYAYVGQYLNITGGTGTAETVVVTATDGATKITALFANTHSGPYNVIAAPLATVTYSSAPVADVAWISRQIACLPNSIKAGDVLTVSRVSTGTGLAQPAGEFQIDWINAGSN